MATRRLGTLNSPSAFVRARVQAALYNARKRRLARQAAQQEPPPPDPEPNPPQEP